MEMIFNFLKEILFGENKKFNKSEIEKLLKLSKIDNKIILFNYKDPLIKEAIKELKFKRNSILATYFAEIIYDVLLEEISDWQNFENFKAPILIPMPTSGQRKQERGFNQILLIAEALKKIDKQFIIEENILFKKGIKAQSLILSKEERQLNIIGSFKIKKAENIKNANIILLDDVISSGATIEEAEKELKKFKARSIKSIILAR